MESTQTQSASCLERMDGYIMSVRELQGAKQSLAVHLAMGETSEHLQTATQGPTPHIPEAMHFNKKKHSLTARELEKAIERGKPPVPSQKEREALEQEKKNLEEEFKKNCVFETREELHVMRQDDPAWDSARKKAAMRPRWEVKINRWRNIERTLYPEDEMSGELNKLRRQRD